MASIFAQQPKPATPSLFGGAATSTPTTSLFGSTTTSTAQPGGLFGASQPAQPATSSLFGAPAAQPATSSLFGASQTQPAQGSSLFGAPANNNQSSLFGSKTQPQSNSLFGQPAASQASTAQPQQGVTLAGSLAGGLGQSQGAFGAQTQRELVQSRLQSRNLNASVREKTVLQQLQTLSSKWDPQSDQTLMQTYLYNAANPAIAPFYHPEFNEDEQKYEEALAKKPEPVDGNSWVPVLTRGFRALGERIEYQARFVQSMQLRLHEMNNSLTAIMQKHAQDLTVRIDASKRQHTAISARTLRLAVKCQVLRNRGYALDTQEEGLRTVLLDLEKKLQDPAYTSREEMIWARLLVLRERSKWLEEETKRLGNAANGQANDENKIPSEVLDGAKRILKSYDLQIQQLNKEIQDIEVELQQWQGDRVR